MSVLPSVAAPPAWKATVGAFKPDVHPRLAPCKLEYSLSWNGALHAGRAAVEFGKKDKRYSKFYTVQAYGRSTGTAATLFPYVFTYTSFMGKNSHRPLVFVSYEKDKKRIENLKNKYRKSEVQHSLTSKKIAGGKASTKSHVFSMTNVHDPLSAIMYIRARALKNGDKINLCLHPFKTPQYATITVLGREKHAGRSCIKLDLKLSNIDVKSHALKNYKKMKKATLWLSDDKERILIELRSQVFIGDVRMVLTKKTPL
ncbi:MAG: DUF3108 domain-containing protein [Akkermansiaceae bacterium]